MHSVQIRTWTIVRYFRSLLTRPLRKTECQNVNALKEAPVPTITNSRCICRKKWGRQPSKKNSRLCLCSFYVLLYNIGTCAYKVNVYAKSIFYAYKPNQRKFTLACITAKFVLTTKVVQLIKFLLNIRGHKKSMPPGVSHRRWRLFLSLHSRPCTRVTLVGE